MGEGAKEILSVSLHDEGLEIRLMFFKKLLLLLFIFDI